MCRSIKQLRLADVPATEEEIRAAALQFVRKVSGYRKPSQKNAAAFEAAVDEIAEVTTRLLAALTPPPAPRVPGPLPILGEGVPVPEGVLPIMDSTSLTPDA